MDNENICSVCGKPLSRYGNRKLKDGAVCRNCIKPASEWLDDSDYERMSVADFVRHLDYRKENEEKVNSFEPDKTIEGKYTLYLSSTGKDFLFSKRKDYKKSNPDVIAFDDITEINIFEEKYLDTEDVDICFNVKLNNDQIDNIYFRVNEFPGLVRDSKEHQEAIDLAMKYLEGFENEEDMDFEQTEGE